MARLEAFALDKTLVEEGIWEPVGAGDIEFKIAWAGTQQFQRAMQRRLKGRQKDVRTDKLPEDEIRRMLAPDIASILITDWKNVEDRPNFDQTWLAEILARPSHKYILDHVWTFANTDKNYQVQQDPNAALGNSEPPSTGS